MSQADMLACLFDEYRDNLRKEVEEVNQDRTPLLDAIANYVQEEPAYFKIPGHRFERGISSRWRKYTGDGIFRFDLTEAEGLDDLHHPEGVILEAQELAAEVFGVRKTYFLVNGTTCGNEAMILSCVKEGEEIIVPRNAHKSVLMGLILSGAKPIWIMPRYDQQTGLCGCIAPEDVEEAFIKHPNCKGVMLVSPTYYGVCSDVKAIAQICHRYGAMLLVDEAHGGHRYFAQQSRGAIALGADMAALSMHKVTGSLTQSSLLHVGSSRVDQGRLETNLHMVQSTSPSYLLMTSLDAARYELALHGKEKYQKALEMAENARERINQIPGMYCVGQKDVKDAIYELDLCRLVISAEQLEISGFQLGELLYDSYRVGVELTDERYAVAIITDANTWEEINRLVEALKNIGEKFRENTEKVEKMPQRYKANSQYNHKIPEMMLTPRQAYQREGKKVLWEEAKGKIAAEALIPYPPGIPLVNPGEILTEEIWNYMEEYRVQGLHFHGPADGELKTFRIISD